ncbi:MAG: hypothetical protein EOO77_37310, partial [Oxalobacteraceae bacterium]
MLVRIPVEKAATTKKDAVTSSSPSINKATGLAIANIGWSVKPSTPATMTPRVVPAFRPTKPGTIISVVAFMFVAPVKPFATFVPRSVSFPPCSPFSSRFRDLQTAFSNSYRAGDETGRVSSYTEYFLGSIIVSKRNGK